MSNISNLFENLMNYNESNQTKKNLKPVIENDSTLLNLTVELPSELDDIEPEDVKVDVGVMTVDTTDVNETPTDNESNEKDEVTIDDNSEDTPEGEESLEKEEPEKEESLKLRKEAIRKKRLEAKKLAEAAKNEKDKCKCTGKEDCECKECLAKKENVSDKEAELALKNIRKKTVTESKCKESLMHLDTKSLNKLISEFVKENYKNIDKVVINKAMLENKILKIQGKIVNMKGESSNISLTNRGFNASKLENKRFVMDFKDTSNTFGIIKESLKQPFIFTCTLKEGILKFEELNYSFKTRINESKLAEVSGKCTLKESAKIINENVDSVKKFNEIVDKIKKAKSTNDLNKCKDEMNNSNIGDTLLAAAQLVWDDVNSKLVGETKAKNNLKN